MAEAVSRLYGIPADDPSLPRFRSKPRPAARSAISRCRSRSSWPAACARRRARSPRRSPRRSGTIDGVRAHRGGAERLRQFLPRPAGAGCAEWLRRQRRAAARHGGKAIVEHTAINPNKAAHIGHLRNAALGDAFGRLLRFRGRDVEIQNYIDDTGVQVADVVVGFRELEHKTLAEVRAIADSEPLRLLLLGPVRARHRVVRRRQGAPEDPRAALHDIEHGGNETAELAAFIADRIVRAHLKTMARMNIGYDLLTWEATSCGCTSGRTPSSS